MSTGFRIFILMLFAFGAIWVYRYRSFEFAEWLWPAPSTLAQDADSSQDYPVEGVVENELDLVWIRLHGQRFQSGSGAEPNLSRRWNPSPEEYDGILTFEEQQMVADLPVEDSDAGDGVLEDDGDPVRDEGATDEPVDDEGTDTEPEVESTPPVVADEEFIYEFQGGDSLWKIAEKYLGAGFRYREICELNKDALRGVKLDRIPTGTKLRIRRQVREETLKNPPARDDTTVEESSARESAEARPRVTSHTVKPNESLTKIANRYYPGDRNAWKIIFEANEENLASADTVRVGQVLEIPLPPSSGRSPSTERRNSR